MDKTYKIKSKMEKPRNLIVIGISGITCGGKTTTACKLSEILPDSKLFSQDDYFLDIDDLRHTWIPQINHINFDILSSLDMEKMHSDIVNYIKNKNFRQMTKTSLECQIINDKDVVNICFEKVRDANVHIIIIEGFCIFNYKPMLDLFDLKYYFTLDETECFERRQKRIYEPPDCPGYFELCAWPEHLKQLDEVKQEVRNVRYFDGNTKNVPDVIALDILRLF